MYNNYRANNFHCNLCRSCHRQDDYQCRESCRLCGTYLFSDDKKTQFTNPYNPYSYISMYHYPYQTYKSHNFHTVTPISPRWKRRFRNRQQKWYDQRMWHN